MSSYLLLLCPFLRKGEILHEIYYDDIEFEDEEVFELFVLRRYLTKHYGYDQAIEFIKYNRY